MKTRISALVLAVLLLLSALPMVSAAEEAKLSVEMTWVGGELTATVKLLGAKGVTNGKVTVEAEAAKITSAREVLACGDSHLKCDEKSVSLAWVGSDCAEEETLLTLTLEAKEGAETVRLSAKADEAYSNGAKVAVTAASAQLRLNPFKDIEKHWAKDDILEAYRLGLFNGMSADEFLPEEKLTRAMLVTVLWRMAGKPEATKKTNFTDLEKNGYYLDAVAWAAENGIVKGVTATKFDPKANITREQFVTMLYRFAEAMGEDVSARADLSAFKDAAKIDAYAREAMQWAAAEGLIKGEPNGKVNPLDPTTRAQSATILVRYIER